MQYRKKPIVIEAFQLPPKGNHNLDQFFEWAEKVGFKNFKNGRDETMIIPTLEGDMEAQPGDYIIKGIKGEFYPCKPDIFEASYEPAESPNEKRKGVLVQTAGGAKGDDLQ